MPFDPLVLGKKIAARREELGLLQREVGAQCGVSQVTVCWWETGRAAPGLIRLGLLADALKMSVAELLDGETPAGDQAVAS